MDMNLLWFGLAIGVVLGCIASAIVVYWMVNNKRLSMGSGKLVPALIAVCIMLAFALPRAAFAQDTPVPLVIPTNTIFTETNNWLATFAPIAAIGIGITLALAVLGYIGKLIASAFR